MWKWIVIAMILVGFGCAQDNAMMVSDNTTLFNGTADPSHTAQDSKIFLTTDPVPFRDGYKLLGEIKVLTVWWGGFDPVYQEMANKALEIGADAVVEMKTWRQPAGGSWAAPQASGMAIQVNDEKFDFTKMSGKWWTGRVTIKVKTSQPEGVEGNFGDSKK